MQTIDPRAFTVLCVDDEPGVLLAVERALHPLGVQIIKADTGEDALALLRQQTVHVMISDAAMPGMHGIELMKRASSIAPGVLRILLSAHTNASGVVEKAVNECAVFRLLTKPWDNAALCIAVIEAFGFTASEWESGTKQSLRKIADAA